MNSTQLQQAIDLLEQADGTTQKLKDEGSWGKAVHRFDPTQHQITALMTAIATGRPLLVRGEPGVGKSQLARAAAAVLKRRFIAAVVQPDTEYTDLLWRLDHTRRLADAQLGNEARLEDLQNYIAPGAIWWAYDWATAEQQHARCPSNFKPHQDSQAPDASTAGTVLLIDEVDKADISLVDGLLEVLGNGAFNVPVLDDCTVKTPEGQPQPLVILTSNNTRELPPAFIRRCVMLDIKLPDDLANYLQTIGAEYYPTMDKAILAEAAKQIMQDREIQQEPPRSGLAEYLDLLRALNVIAPNDSEKQREQLERLAPHLCKHNA